MATEIEFIYLIELSGGHFNQHDDIVEVVDITEFNELVNIYKITKMMNVLASDSPSNIQFSELPSPYLDLQKMIIRCCERNNMLFYIKATVDSTEMKRLLRDCDSTEIYNLLYSNGVQII